MTEPPDAAPPTDGHDPNPTPRPGSAADDGDRPDPAGSGDPAPTDPAPTEPARTSAEPSEPSAARQAPDAPTDPGATTQFPRADWGSAEEVPTHAPGPFPDDRAGDRSGEQTSARANEHSDEPTRDFPAYRPQSYPTYPPTMSQTTELPAVGAAGPPPTTAAAYGPGSSASAVPSTSAPDGRYANAQPASRRRDGAGLAGALGVIGIGAAAVGLLALPMQRYGQAQNVYLGTFRDLATRTVPSSARNHHSVSLAGEHLATVWWRLAVLPALGVLAALFLVMICIPVLRRVAGALLFLGVLAVLAGFAIAVPKTNQYRATVVLLRFTRFGVHDLAPGFWIGIGGLVALGLAGLVASVQSTRR